MYSYKLRPLLLACSMLFFIGPKSYAQQEYQKKSAEELFEAGEGLMNKNKWSNALESFDRCLLIDPVFADAYYARGLVKEHFEQWTDALTDFSIHLTFKPAHSEALFKRAQLHYRLKHYTLAKEDFLHLLSLPAGETSTVFFERGGFGGEVNQIFTAQGGGKKRIYNALALTEIELHEYTQALSHLDSAIRLSPRDADLFINKGIAYQKVGALEKAKEAYDMALHINPEHAIAYLNLQSLNSKLNGTQSTHLLDSAIANNTKLPYAYAERGYLRLSKGAYLDALADYNQAININPKEAEYFLNRGLIHEKLLHPEEAYRDYSSAIRLDERLVSAWLNRGNVLRKLRKERLAIEDYSAAIAFDGDYAAAYYNRGIVYYELKEYSAACSDLLMAKRLGQPLSASLESKACGK